MFTLYGPMQRFAHITSRVIYAEDHSLRNDVYMRLVFERK